MGKGILIFIYILLAPILCKAQQEVLYTQYNSSQLAINPAYAGNNTELGFTALSRKQWIGLEGSPTSVSFFADGAVLGRKIRRSRNLGEKGSNDNKLGIGLVIFNDKVGVNNTFQASLAYSYKINFSSYTRLSFGFQTGIMNFMQSFKKLENIDPNDAVFQEDVNLTKFNIGAGIIFETEHYFVGFSVPSLIKNSLDPINETGEVQLRQYFLSAGYLFYLHPRYKLRPSTVVRYTEEFPAQFDVNMHLVYNDRIWTGLSYHSNSSVSLSTKIMATKSLGFGLAYDFDIGEIRNISHGSAEILLSYVFNKSKKRIIDPRYF